MTCKRGHNDWFLTKRVGKRNRVCEFIIGYKQDNDGTNALFCCDIPIGKTMPEGYLPLTEGL